MALQVWLPLNGNLNNQGLTDITVTNSGATVDNNGKIGKCYDFNGTYMSFTRPLDNPCSVFSVAGWVKLNSGYAANNGFHIIVFGSANAYQRICISKDGYAVRVLINYNGTSISANSTASASTLSAGVWNHFAITYNAGKLDIYINGVLDKSQTVSISNIQLSDTFRIGTYSAETAKGCLNDFRLYDHALSAKEVKELSKGLVCHYPLNGNGRGLPNLLTEAFWTFSNSGFNIKNVVNCTIKPVVNTDTSITFTGGGTGGSGNTQCYTTNQGYHITVSPNTTYTLSMKCTTVGAVTFRIYWYEYNGSSHLSTTSKAYTFTDGETKTITFTRTTGSTCNNFYIELNLYNQPTTSTLTILPKSLKLEVGDTVTMWMPNEADTLYSQLGYDSTTEYDVSGYGYNMDSYGSITYDSDSPRYSVCPYYQNTDMYLSATSPTSTVRTISFWVKYTSAISDYRVAFGDYKSHLAFGMINSTSACVTCSNQSKGTFTITAPTANKWYHIVVKRASDSDSADVELYINGVKQTTRGTADNWQHDSDTLMIGRRARGSSVVGYISDFRAYATVLSADDIKELYETSASIDNKGNMFAYEFSEPSNAELLAVPYTNSVYVSDPTAEYTTRNSDGEYYYEGAMISSGSEYIKVNPSGKTYYYDALVSVSAGNQFYIGFERYDANKTSRSNNACVYIAAPKPSSDLVRYRYKGTVNLSTDGVNPCDTIRIRILNGWTGSDSSSTKKATVHYLSLREVTTLETTSIFKQGITKTDMLLESDLKDIEKNGIINMQDFIEI